MDYEPPDPFVTSILELKLDVNTMFEWHKHSQSSAEVPHYKEGLLEFINLRAQASETSASNHGKKSSKGPLKKPFTLSKPVASFATNTTDPASDCVLCKTDKHPLYVCPKFKNQPHDKMIATLKANDLCTSCLRPGHYVNPCINATSVKNQTTPCCTLSLLLRLLLMHLLHQSIQCQFTLPLELRLNHY